MWRSFLVLLICWLVVSPIMADERQDTLRQIEMAKQEVAELEQALSKLKVQQSASIKQLRVTETQIANLEKKIRELKKELTNTEAKLTWLAEAQKKAEQKRQEQEKIFASQAKATYESGRQEYLKLLLNQQDLDKVSRTLIYYDYLSQARLVQLTEFQETIKQLQAIEAEMNHYQQQLSEQNTALQEQRKQLAAVRQKRLQVLATINKQIKAKTDRIADREKDQVALNNVLTTIDNTLTQQTRNREIQQGTAQAEQVVSSVGQGFSGSFTQSKGKLPWPVTGKIIASYGSVRGDDNRTKWDGVLIAANRGVAVKAIHDGRVVYADWLRGVGWLVIIDHGQGYYSLYGHNQSLLKKVGDIVKTGDTVATVGSSGGIDSTALYFSIRQHGQTINPTLWCH